MNNKGKTDEKVIGIVIILAVMFLLLFWFSSPAGKTILEHKQPADISDKEKGTGLDLSFYDEDGNEIEIPDWFSTASKSNIGTFSIVRHPPAPTCTTRTQCSGYETNPNIGCWGGKCVLQNVASMNAGVNVNNPTASEVAFLNVKPTSASPTAFWNNIDRTALSKLSPGETVSWGTSTSDGGVGPFSVTAWEGSSIAFKVTVTGENEYTGENFPISDTITLAFDANPIGTFSVSVVSDAPEV